MHPLVWLFAYSVPSILVLTFSVGWYWFLPAYIFGIVPILDHLIGDRIANPDLDPNDWQYRIVPLLAVPIHLATLAWATHHSSTLTGWDLAGAMIAMGIHSATIAINVAHELIHRSTPFERIAGGVLLSSVLYPSFKVEHIRGHHRDVATPNDASSAPRGSTIYTTTPRAILRNLRHAIRLDLVRLRRHHLPWYHSELLPYFALTLAFILFAALHSATALAFFIAQGIQAIIWLEIINYVEHYGLARQSIAPGRYEKVQPHHSWNSPRSLTNLVLFNLQRHSDHHAYPTRPYHTLRHHSSAPQLPAGYATMILVAFVPPLWRHLVHPRLPRIIDNDKY